MNNSAFLLAGLALVVAGPAAAQPSAVINLNEKAKSFSTAEYDRLVACTVSKYPVQTREFAEYFVQRRSLQTPDQNEADPASKLGMVPISGCYAIELGKPLPFNLERLVGDWAKHHKITDAAGTQVSDMRSLARCSVAFNRSMANAYLQAHAIAQMTGSERDQRTRRMLVQAVAMPPCAAAGELEIDHDKLARMIAGEMQSQQAQP